MQIPKFLIRKSHTLCDLNITKSFFKTFPAFSMIQKRETRQQAYFNMHHTHTFNSTVFFCKLLLHSITHHFQKMSQIFMARKDSVLFAFPSICRTTLSLQKKRNTRTIYIYISSPFLSTNHVWNFISRGYSFHDNPLHLPPQC